MGLLLVRRRDHDVRMGRLHRLLLMLLMMRLVQHARYRRWRQLLVLHSAAHPVSGFTRAFNLHLFPSSLPPVPGIANSLTHSRKSFLAKSSPRKHLPIFTLDFWWFEFSIRVNKISRGLDSIVVQLQGDKERRRTTEAPRSLSRSVSASAPVILSVQCFATCHRVYPGREGENRTEDEPDRLLSTPPG